MGWCREFGPQIQDGCSHPMVAEAACCTCRECGAICRGRFNGCPTVWATSTAMPVAATGEFEPRRPQTQPHGLAEIRQRLEGLRGAVKTLGSEAGEGP